MRIVWFSVLSMALVAALVGCGGGGGGGGSPVLQYGSVTGTVYAVAGTSSTVSTASAKSAGGTRKLTVGPITTTTRDATQQPVVGATVAVSGYPKLTATTNAQGVFLIQQVPSGQQTVIISDGGYTTLNVPVQVAPGNTPTVVTPPTATKAQYDWTVLIYVDADNNLEPWGLANCMQMEQAGSTGQVEILAQFSRPPNHYNDPTDDPNGVINADAKVNGLWSGARRYLITKATNPNETAMCSTMLQNLGSVDMGNPQTLNNFVVWGQSYAPANHYMVILWDHGSGWDPSGDATRVTARAICFDDVFNDDIRDTELPAALAAQNPIDIIGTDACLMSMAEVAYQLRSSQPSYLVGSEEETPVNGLPYTDILTKLDATPTIDPHDYATYIAQSAVSYWSGSTVGYSIAACSAIDLSQMSNVATALAPFTARLIADSAANASQLDTASANCERFGPDLGSVFADLTDYANYFSGTGVHTPVISGDALLQSDAQQLTSAVSRAVVATDAASGHPNAHGMSVYFPNYVEYTSPLYGSADSFYPLLAINLAGAPMPTWSQWLLAQPQQ